MPTAPRRQQAARVSSRAVHLAPVHPAADRHDAARHRRCSWSAPSPTFRCRWRQPADVDVPIIRVTAQPARRRSRDHGGDRRGAAGAAARRDRRRQRDSPRLDRSARPHRRSSSIWRATSTARRATCRRRSTPPPPTCRPTCRRCRPSARPIRPRAGADPGADLGHAAADRRSTTPPTPCWRSASSQVEGVAEVHGQRRRAAGDPRAARSAAPRRHGRRRSTTCATPSPTPTSAAPLGSFDGPTRAETLGTNDQLSAPEDYRRASWCKTQRRAWCGWRDVADVEPRRAQRAGPPAGSTSSPRCC